MSGKCTRVVQAQRDGDSGLERGKNPDFHPTSFLVKVPREKDACLHYREYILSTDQCFVDVLSSFACMELSELIAACPIR